MRLALAATLALASVPMIARAEVASGGFTWRGRRAPSAIIDEARAWASRQGVPWRPVAAALLSTAWEESRFESDAVGDQGSSFGLYQLHFTRRGGSAMGDASGLTTTQAMDPTLATRAVLAAMAGSSQVMAAARSGDAGQLARVLTMALIRPADTDTRAAARADLAAAMMESL